jgi:hypothetical protein
MGMITQGCTLCRNGAGGGASVQVQTELLRTGSRLLECVQEDSSKY